MVSKSDNWSGRSNDSLRLTVTQGTQNVTNNTTVVNWYLDIIEVNGTWTNDPTGSYSIYINGSHYTGTVPGYAKYSTTRVRSGSTTVTHNADGTKTISMSASASGVNILGSASIGSFSLTLSTIPRATTPSFSGGSTWDCGDAKTINLPRASTSFTHVVSYKFGSASGTISSSATTSVSWTPPLSLLAQIPNATSGTGTLTVVTKSGSTTIGTKTASFKLNAPAEAKPSISSFTLSDNTPSVVSLIGAYVQGYSMLKGVIGSSGYQGSTITSATFKMGSVSANSGGTIPITGSGTITVTATVVDSRGRSVTSSQNITVLAYSKPKIVSWQARRSDAAGNAQNEGTYIRVDVNATISSLLNGSTQKNSMTINVYTKDRGTSSWGSAKRTITAALSYSSYFVIPSSGAGVYLVDDSYDIQLSVVDKLDTANVEKTISTASIFMHWSKTGVGVGKFHENGRLDVAGDIFQSGNKVLDSKTITDWNAAIIPGLYMGVNAANQPVRNVHYVDSVSHTWWSGLVEVYYKTDIVIKQRLSRINYDTSWEFARHSTDGGATWSPWVNVGFEEAWTDLTDYMASGISYTPDGAGDLAGIRARRVGKMVELSMGNFVIDTMTIPTSGNVANRDILVDLPTKFRPATGISIGSGWNGQIWGGYVRPNGSVVFGAVMGLTTDTGTVTRVNQQYSGGVSYSAAN